MLQRYNSVGITSIYDRSEGPEGFRAYQALHKAGELTARSTVTYLISAAGTPAQVRQEIERIPFVTGWGDDWLRVGTLKTVVDGGILIGTAYLREPYGRHTQIYGFDDPDYRGVLSVPRENLFEMAKTANELGWQMTAHTTGGGATDLLLDAYEAADRIASIKDRRFTVTHGNFPNRGRDRPRKEARGVVRYSAFLALPGRSRDQGRLRSRPDEGFSAAAFVDRRRHRGGRRIGSHDPFRPARSNQSLSSVPRACGSRSRARRWMARW